MKEGQYYYAPHRRSWGVWKNHNHSDGSSSGEFIADFSTKVQARNFVYKMNNWSDKSEEENED